MLTFTVFLLAPKIPRLADHIGTALRKIIEAVLAGLGVRQKNTANRSDTLRKSSTKKLVHDRMIAYLKAVMLVAPSSIAVNDAPTLPSVTKNMFMSSVSLATILVAIWFFDMVPYAVLTALLLAVFLVFRHVEHSIHRDLKRELSDRDTIVLGSVVFAVGCIPASIIGFLWVIIGAANGYLSESLYDDNIQSPSGILSVFIFYLTVALLSTAIFFERDYFARLGISLIVILSLGFISEHVNSTIDCFKADFSSVSDIYRCTLSTLEL